MTLDIKPRIQEIYLREKMFTARSLLAYLAARPAVPSALQTQADEIRARSLEGFKSIREQYLFSMSSKHHRGDGPPSDKLAELAWEHAHALANLYRHYLATKDVYV